MQQNDSLVNGQVTSASDDRTATDSVTIHVLAGAPPAVEISRNDRFNTGELHHGHPMVNLVTAAHQPCSHMDSKRRTHTRRAAHSERRCGH